MQNEFNVMHTSIKENGSGGSFHGMVPIYAAVEHLRIAEPQCVGSALQSLQIVRF